VNWVELLDLSLFVLGFGFLAVGIGLVASAAWEKVQQNKRAEIPVDVSYQE
jgi:hypothetical protein